jgi:hypothetical protein
MKKLLVLLLFILILPALCSASTKLLDYGWEDWTGNANTTPGYIVSAEQESYWNDHLADSEVVSAYDPTGSQTNLTSHSGSYFLLRNDSSCCNLDPAVAGITRGDENDHFNVGLNGQWGGGNTFDLDSITTGIYYVQFFFALNSNWVLSPSDRGDSKFIRWYTDGSLTNNIYCHLSYDGKLAIYANGSTRARTGVLSDINNWAWHKLAMMVNINTSTIYVWYDVTTPTLANATLSWTGSLGVTDITDCFVIQGNFSGNNPASLLFHAIDDVEIWDGLPDVGGNVPPTISITTPASCPANTTSTPFSIQGTATDSDGTILSVSWSNLTTSGSGACTADDGTFDEASEAFTCSVSLSSGANNVIITGTDNDFDSGISACTVNYSAAGDSTPPTIAITSPTVAGQTTYYNIENTTSQVISGTCNDASGAPTIAWTCPTCTTTTGTATCTGNATWTITVSPLASEYGTDLVTDGAFPTFDNWAEDAGWTLVDGKAASAGTPTNQSIQQEIGSITIYANYTVWYDSDHTSGTLYLSQWGFPGEGYYTAITTSPDGRNSATVVCQGEPLLRFTTDDWVGTLDNVVIKQKGTRNVVTVTATDSSGNFASDIMYVNSYYTFIPTPVSINSSPGAVNAHYDSGNRRLVREGDTLIALVPESTSYDHTYRSTANGASGTWTEIDTDGSYSGALVMGKDYYVYHFYDNNTAIYMVKFLYSGTPAAPVLIKSKSASDCGAYRSVAATVDSNGKLYVAYHGGSPDGLYVITSTDYGVSWSDPYTVAAPTVAGSYFIPHMDVTSGNVPVIVYRNYTTQDIFFAKSSDGGVTWTGNSVAISTDDRNNPDILTDGSSTLYLFAQSAVSSPCYGLIYKKSTDSGDTWGSWACIEATITVSGYADPSSALGDDGAIYVAYRNDSQVGDSAWRLHVARSTDGGTNWTTIYDYDEASDRTGARNHLRYQTWFNGGGPLDVTWMQGVPYGTQHPIYFNTNNGITIEETTSTTTPPSAKGLIMKGATWK